MDYMTIFNENKAQVSKEEKSAAMRKHSYFAYGNS